MTKTLCPCPMCGGTQGYTLHDGSTYRWWHVQCKDCGRDVDECRSDGSTHLNHPKPERWDAADEVWNGAGVYASGLAAQVREQCAQACERARPDGGRAWSEAQHACFDALSHVAAFIREMK